MTPSSGTFPVRTWWREHPLFGDFLLAAVMFAAIMLMWFVTPETRWPHGFGYALLFTALGLFPVVIRRRWLWLAVISALALNMTLPFLPYTTGAEGLTLMVVAYTAAAILSLRLAVLATLLVWVPPLIVLSAYPPTVEGFEQVGLPYVLTTNVLLAAVVFFIGRTVYTRRQYITALEERAKAAESNQRALAAQAVTDERQRIARELHDVVAHHVSVIGVLAAAARRTGQRDPEATDSALASIEETSRSAMRELRRLLGVLRTAGEPAELSPQPGLAGVQALVEQVRDAGLPVTLQIEGEPPELDPGISLTIYRIVQEALTNTIKHAGPARATVRLTCAPDLLTVEVTDNGRGPTSAPSGVGHGLVGMRERVALYGGELRTGHRPGGGFRVYATIPVEQPDAPSPQRVSAGRVAGILSGKKGAHAPAPSRANREEVR